MFLLTFLTTCIVVFFYRTFRSQNDEPKMVYPFIRFRPIVYHMIVGLFLLITIGLTIQPWISAGQLLDLLSLELFRKSVDTRPAAVALAAIVFGVAASISNGFGLLLSLTHFTARISKAVILIFTILLALAKLSELANFFTSSPVGEAANIIVMDTVATITAFAGAISAGLMFYEEFTIGEVICEIDENPYYMDEEGEDDDEDDDVFV